MHRLPIHGFILCLILVGLAPGGAWAAVLEVDNGVIKLKVDTTSYGGAITYLSESGSSTNLVNLADRGREIQQSYYAGLSLDRTAEGQSPTWSPWPWNPIQVGDCGMHSSPVTTYTVTGNTIYTNTIPLLWDMTNNEQAEADMEQWSTLTSNTVHVVCKLTCRRTPGDAWGDGGWGPQEMPAVYTIANLYRQFTYVGMNPWEDEALTEIVHRGWSVPPWTTWGGPGTAHPGLSERWSANVDNSLWGVGVYYKRAISFNGGVHGNTWGTQFSDSTSHIAPITIKVLERDTVWEWEYDLIVGTLDQIRAFVYADPPTEIMGPMAWEFNTDGDLEEWYPWNHMSGTQVSGGVLSTDAIGNDPMLLSGKGYQIDGAANPWVHIRMKNGTSSIWTQLFWTNLNGSYGGPRAATVATTTHDDFYKVYHFDMSAMDEWVTTGGAIFDFRLDPLSGPIGHVDIDWIRIDNVPPPVRWYFETDDDPEGWTFSANTTAEAVSGGAMSFDLAADPPQLISPKFKIDATTHHWVHVRMRNATAGTTAYLFWTNEFGGHGGPRTHSFSVSANDTEFVDYHIDLSGVAGWTGTITDLRLDPVWGATSGTIEIDHVTLGAFETDAAVRSPWCVYE